MSAPIAFLCSGQGGQHAAMFELLADEPRAAPIFTAATEVLGQDPRVLVRQPGARLFDGVTAQLLCVTQALAAWAALAGAVPRAVLAGYSVGELAAWGCAGIFDVQTTLHLAKHRAVLMQDAAPPGSGLAAVRGLTASALAPLLAAHGAVIAITNAPDHFVLGGATAALDALCAAALAHGAVRALRLPVAVPAHTPLLLAAVAPFEAALRAARPGPVRGNMRLLGGLDGRTVFDVQSGCAALARQIASPISWAGCLDACAASGAALVLELGPGGVLARMAEANFPAGTVRALEDFRTVEGACMWLERGAGILMPSSE